MAWCAAALVVAFLVPNHYSPWLSFHSEIIAALAFVPMMLWALVRPGPAPAMTVAVLILACVPVAQFIAGQFSFAGDAWMAWLYLTGFGLAALAGARWAEGVLAMPSTLKGLTPLWVGLVVAAYTSVAIALHQSLDLGPFNIYWANMRPGGRAFANLSQPNQLATLLLIAVAAHVALYEAGRMRGAVACLGVCFLTLGVALTGSRSVFLALAWLWPMYWLMRQRAGLRTRVDAVFGACVFLVGAMVVWPMLREELLLAAGPGSVVDRLDTPDVRGVYWRSMLDAISREPWVGYGWGQIGRAQMETVLDYPATFSNFDSSHNLFLDLMLWNGAVIGAAAILALGAWLVSQVYRCRSPDRWAVLVAIGFVLSHAMVEYPLNYAYFLLPVGFFMGVLTAAPVSNVDRSHSCVSKTTIRVAIMGMGALALALVVKVGWEYPQWEQDWQYMRYQEARIGEPLRVEPPTYTVLTQLSAFLRFSRTKPDSAMSDKDLERMRQVSTRFPYASAMYRYALALALNGRPAEAKTALRRLCSMHTKTQCSSARRQWVDVGWDQHPELACIRFPDSMPEKDDQDCQGASR